MTVDETEVSTPKLAVCVCVCGEGGEEISYDSDDSLHDGWSVVPGSLNEVAHGLISPGD